MDNLFINEEVIQEKPYLFSEPTLYFSRHGGGYEGTKNKISGLKNNEPFDVNTGERDFDKINIIPVTVDNKKIKYSLNTVLKRLKEKVWQTKYKEYSFEDLFQCKLDYSSPYRCHTVEDFSREEYEKIGREISAQYTFHQGDTRNIVVFVTQSSSSNQAELEDSEYFGMKKALVKGFLPSQSLSSKDRGIIDKVNRNKLNKYSLINLASQIYAKVGGIPWSLKQPENQTYAEINIGIRAGRPKNKDSNYIYGVAQVFSKDGQWVDTRVEEEQLSSESYEMPETVMTQLLENSIEGYKNKIQADTPLKKVDRVNLHKPKGFSNSEIETVKEFSSGKNTDFSLIGITRSKIRLYTKNSQNVKNIRRGYFKQFNENAGLLCTTGDYKTKWGWKEHRLGTPVPQLIQVVDDEELVTPQIKDVAKNVFILTRLNWGDVMSKEISQPVTTHYARKVANMAAKGVEVEKITEDIPWFL